MLTPVDTVPVPPSGKRFWVRLRYVASGYETTYFEKSEVNCRILIAVTSRYADVVSFGQIDSRLHDATVASAPSTSKPSF